MFEDLKALTQKPMEEMKKQQMAAQATKMGSIHYTLTRLKDDQSIELQWNVYYGEHITPDLVKKELEKWNKSLLEKQ